MNSIIEIDFNQAMQLLNPSLVFLGLMFTAFQLRQNAQISREQFEWNRRQITIQALNQRSELDLCGVTKRLNLRDRNSAIKLEEILDAFHENRDYEVGAVRLLNYYNRLCQLALADVYDKKMILSARESLLTKTYIRFEKYIQHRRDVTEHCDKWKSLETFAKQTGVYKHYMSNRETLSRPEEQIPEMA